MELVGSTALDYVSSINNSWRSLFEQLFEDKSSVLREDDEIGHFTTNTSCSNRVVDPLQWWKANESRYPTTAAVPMDVLAR